MIQKAKRNPRSTHVKQFAWASAQRRACELFPSVIALTKGQESRSGFFLKMLRLPTCLRASRKGHPRSRSVASPTTLPGDSAGAQVIHGYMLP